VDLTRVPHLRPPPPVEAPAFDDPDFVRASAWLARAPSSPDAVVVGAPFGGGSISRARCDLAPAAIRAELARFSVWSSDDGVSLERIACLDAGDVEPDDDVAKTQDRIAEALRAIRGQADVPLALLGGDNSVTVGGARGAEADGLITLDAHHDCRDPARGLTNGCPVRQLVEGGLTHVSQIGIHGFANAEPHARWALDHKLHWVTADMVRSEGMKRAVSGALRFLGPARRIWVDVDLDVIARALAPGAPASMPGGLTPADVEDAAFLLGKDARVVGMDVCELDPSQDVANATVRAACAVLLSFLAGVASR
jgi:formiminoglutamase